MMLHMHAQNPRKPLSPDLEPEGYFLLQFGESFLVEKFPSPLYFDKCYVRAWFFRCYQYRKYFELVSDAVFSYQELIECFYVIDRDQASISLQRFRIARIVEFRKLWCFPI